jgi:hypothetical protein
LRLIAVATLRKSFQTSSDRATPSASTRRTANRGTNHCHESASGLARSEIPERRVPRVPLLSLGRFRRRTRTRGDADSGAHPARGEGRGFSAGRVTSADGTSVGYEVSGEGPALLVLYGAGRTAYRSQRATCRSWVLWCGGGGTSGVREMAAAGLAGVGGASERKRGKEYVIDEQERALMMTTKTRHEEGSIVRKPPPPRRSETRRVWPKRSPRARSGCSLVNRGQEG